MKANARYGTSLVLCAPSGTGKTTLVRRLVEEFPCFSFSVSYTTRPPRSNETDGVDYRFIDEATFFRMRDERAFAEWACVHGNFYGTPLQETGEMLRRGRDVLFDIDVQGAAQLRLTMPQALFVFLLPPSRAVLEGRLRKRGTDSEETIQKRLKAARGEIAQANWFDAWIINDDLERAYQDLRSAYTTATLAPARRPGYVNTLLQEWL